MYRAHKANDLDNSHALNCVHYSEHTNTFRFADLGYLKFEYQQQIRYLVLLRSIYILYLILYYILYTIPCEKLFCSDHSLHLSRHFKIHHYLFFY